MKPGGRWGEPVILDLLAERYPSPGWVFLRQVRSRTGYQGAIRTADGLAISLYPSRGLGAEGFEIKVSRQDWVKELREPQKAEEIAQHCRCWWLVTPEGVVEPGELPPTWGHMLVREGRRPLRAVREAPVRKVPPPSWDFVCAIFRNAGKIDEEALKREYHKGVEEGQERERSVIKTDSDRQLRDLQFRVERFEQASGVSIGNDWTGHDIGEAVREVLAVKTVNGRRELELLKASVERISDRITRELEGLTNSSKKEVIA